MWRYDHLGCRIGERRLFTWERSVFAGEWRLPVGERRLSVGERRLIQYGRRRAAGSSRHADLLPGAPQALGAPSGTGSQPAYPVRFRR
jgi:hypothetical protein